MADNEKDTSDIYAISGPSTPPDTTHIPSEHSDIFAVKKENLDRLSSTIAMTLGAGVFLCNAYRLDKQFVRNEMGEIWKASDLGASRNVIIYLPPTEIRKDESATEPIRQNAKRVEALDHPRIVPALENFTDPEHGFFTVRKFVNGHSLDVYRKEYVNRHKKISPGKAVKILNDLAHALDYAHGVDIIHGDLCPKNIIVALNDEIFLDNFALLPVLSEHISAERIPYLSPEVIAGQTAALPSDVYALAVIAYELLACHLPFPPGLMNDVPLPIPHVPSSVDAVIRKAMSRDPDDRYDSCGAFVKALESSFQERKPIKRIAVQPLPKPKPSKMDIIIRLLWMGAIIAMLLPVGTVFWFHWQLHTSTADPESPQDVVMQSAETEELVETEAQAVDAPETESEPLPEIVEPVSPPESEQTQPDPIEAETIDAMVPNEEPSVAPVVESVESPPTPPAAFETPLYKEGEQRNMTVGTVEYGFRWYRQEQVMAGGFWIQETAVTQEFWRNVMRSLPRQPEDGPLARLPVRNVSWNECQQFIEHLNADPAILASEEFAGYRFALPTVAQWDDAYAKNALAVNNNVLEWCFDWSDAEKRYRVVRGAGANSRVPERGYDEVGFRLAIVCDQQE